MLTDALQGLPATGAQAMAGDAEDSSEQQRFL